MAAVYVYHADLVRSSSARLCPPSILIGKKRVVQLRILGPLFPAAHLPPSSVGCVRAWSGIYRAAGFFFSDLLTVAIGVAGVLGSGADRFSWLSWLRGYRGRLARGSLSAVTAFPDRPLVGKSGGAGE
ncbi:hypothetical protein ACOSQ2_010386 [Xanthoceras sorbifolium]